MPAQKVAVITGASSGIGKAIAKSLASDGWRIIGIGRNPERIAAATQEISAASNNDAVEILQADISLLSSARAVAQQILERTDRIDVLFNNAGGMTSELVLTSEGLEENFASNHLGPFVLTNELLPLLRTSAQDREGNAARILMTSSDASEMTPGLNLDDMQAIGNFNPGLSYCTGKLANVLFAKALAQKFGNEGIVAHSVHPGAVASNFFTYAPKDTQERVRDLKMATEEEGADTLIWLANTDAGLSNNGAYWHKREQRKANPVSEDPDFINRFWDASQALVDSVKG